MTEPALRHLEVPRTARYAILGEPGPTVRELWVVLHGYRQLAARFIRRFHGISRPWRLIVAPEALNRFYVGDAPGRHGPDSVVGGTWMTREDRETEIRDYVRYLDRLHDHIQGTLPAPVPLVALGFSQGCHTAARWSAYGRARPGTLILWGEVLPPDLEPVSARAGLGGARILSVQGREDASVTQDRLVRQETEAAALELDLGLRWHPLGHVIDPDTLSALAAEVAAGPLPPAAEGA